MAKNTENIKKLLKERFNSEYLKDDDVKELIRKKLYFKVEINFFSLVLSLKSNYISFDFIIAIAIL